MYIYIYILRTYTPFRRGVFFLLARSYSPPEHMTEVIFFFPSGVTEVLRSGGAKVMEILGAMVIRTRLFVRAALGDGVGTPLTITRGVSLRAGMRDHGFLIFFVLEAGGNPIPRVLSQGVLGVAPPAPETVRRAFPFHGCLC